MAAVYDNCSEITPNIDVDWSTSSVDRSSQDFLIQSDVFFARGPWMPCAKFMVLELETCNYVICIIYGVTQGPSRMISSGSYNPERRP